MEDDVRRIVREEIRAAFEAMADQQYEEYRWEDQVAVAAIHYRISSAARAAEQRLLSLLNPAEDEGN